MRVRRRKLEGAWAWGAGALGLGLCALVAACAPNLTTTGGEGGEGGDGNGATGASGGAAGFGGGGGAGGEIVCPEALNTPTMVPVASASGNYCIDSTEVTNRQYAAWLAAVNAGEVEQTPECDFNTSFVPTDGMPPPADDRPVVFVDWCDAHAFCKWNGKRLCGKIGGGPVPYADINDAAASQWYNACSGSGKLVFPYGNTYDPLVCNGHDRMAGTSVEVGTQSSCEGGLPGVFDLSGNVWEWEDACDGSTGSNDTCRRRGGGYESITSDLDCPTTGGGARIASNETTGFRCCVDVP